MNIHDDRVAGTKRANAASAYVAQQKTSRKALPLKDNRPGSVMQQKRLDAIASRQAATLVIQKKESHTGRPGNLKSGVENLPGISMDDVMGERAFQLSAFSSNEQAELVKINNSSLPIQAKWVQDSDTELKWNGLLDGVQWFEITGGEQKGLMYYVVIEPEKIKPGMLESYMQQQNTPMPRDYWASGSVFGDIYKDLDAAVITPEEAEHLNGALPLQKWFHVNTESVAGAWIKRILDNPFEDVKEEFTQYLRLVYAEGALKLTHQPSEEEHVQRILKEVANAKRNIDTLSKKYKPGDKTEIMSKIRDLMESYIDSLTRLVPVIPDAGRKILGNIEDIRKDKETQGGTHKLVHFAGGLGLLGKDGNTVKANGPFVFVVPVQTKTVLLGARKDGGHTVVSQGGDVYFAGQMDLEDGKMVSWSNDSGHYRTPKEMIGELIGLGLDALLPPGKYKPVN